MESCEQSCPTTRNKYVAYDEARCSINGSVVPLLIDYIYCQPERIGSWYGENNYGKTGFHCRCVTDLLHDCMADMNDNQICRPLFPIIISIETIIIIVALLLNGTICYSFFMKLLLRKENPTVVLFNQAVADIVNCLVYAFPNDIFLMILHATKATKRDILEEPKHMDTVGNTTLTLTASASVGLFVIAATDRFLALYKPVWHKVRMNKRVIWRAVIVNWMIAITLSLVIPIISNTSNEPESQFESYKIFLLATLVIVLIYVTTIYIFTFFLAYRAVYKRANNTEEAIAQSKKEFKLVAILIAMYLIFVIGSAPLIITTAANELQYSLRSQVLFLVFTFTSLLNPLLTLYLKSEFRLGSCGCRRLKSDEIPL